MGRYDESEVIERKALDLFERTIGPQRPECAGARENLAALLARRGDLAAAEREVSRALEIYRATVGPEHPDARRCTLKRVRIQCAIGPCEAAKAEGRRALEAMEAALGSSHPDVAEARRDFAKPYPVSSN